MPFEIDNKRLGEATRFFSWEVALVFQELLQRIDILFRVLDIRFSFQPLCLHQSSFCIRLFLPASFFGLCLCLPLKNKGNGQEQGHA
jgi:hypothetical protein